MKSPNDNTSPIDSKKPYPDHQEAKSTLLPLAEFTAPLICRYHTVYSTVVLDHNFDSRLGIGYSNDALVLYVRFSR